MTRRTLFQRVGGVLAAAVAVFAAKKPDLSAYETGELSLANTIPRAEIVHEGPRETFEANLEPSYEITPEYVAKVKAEMRRKAKEEFDQDLAKWYSRKLNLDRGETNLPCRTVT